MKIFKKIFKHRAAWEYFLPINLLESLGKQQLSQANHKSAAKDFSTIQGNSVHHSLMHSSTPIQCKQLLCRAIIQCQPSLEGLCPHSLQHSTECNTIQRVVQCSSEGQRSMRKHLIIRSLSFASSI